MGCSGSKLDKQRPVALCRGRAELLAAAVRHRHALADAHGAYAQSLLDVSAALHRILFVSDFDSSSPNLRLPSRRKSSPSPPPPPTISTSGRKSDFGSHIQFQPTDSEDDGNDEDDEDDDEISPFHSTGSSPIHHFQGEYQELPIGGHLPDERFHLYTETYDFPTMYYARSQPPPASVSVSQRPPTYERIHYNNFFESSYDNYGYSDSQFNYNPMMSARMAGGVGSSSSREPPPPPSPPTASTWDFLNPFQFQSYSNYYNSYTPSRSSREVREEEGIPELEEVEQEVVKKAYVDQNVKSFSSRMSFRDDNSSLKAESIENRDRMSSAADKSYYYRQRSGRRSTYEPPHVVDKNVVGNEVNARLSAEQSKPAAVRTSKSNTMSDVTAEIIGQFERAAQLANDLSTLLEVEKHHHHQKHFLHEVSSRMIRSINHPSSFEGALLNYGEDKATESRGLASTLQKLYIWEKKLYEEVRAEEKMRLLLNKNSKRLRHLDEKGAESEKIDEIRNLIRKLSTKIRIAIKVVDSISKKINKLRDEELWPQINELIIGIERMWHNMLECHQRQCQAIADVKSINSTTSDNHISTTSANDIIQLEVELLKWIGNFSAWINAQRNYVKALNGWLILCLNYQPEPTVDGFPPYSPGRFGAPPVFVVCNFWSQVLDRICEKDALDAMQAFASTIHKLWLQQNLDQHERLTNSRDLDRWHRAVDRKIQCISKDVDSLNKKLALVPGQIGISNYAQLHEGNFMERTNLNFSLRHVFGTMESLASSFVEAYDELNRHCEQDRAARQNAKVS